jgi:uncharacterized protein
VRVVLDTNVLFAAYASHGLCESLMIVCLNEHEIVLSEHILGELRRHLIGKLRMTDQHAGEIELLLREHCTIVEPTPLPEDACRDPDDVPVLGTAATARADALVTGDADLLALVEWRGILILSPRAFYDRLK